METQQLVVDDSSVHPPKKLSSRRIEMTLAVSRRISNLDVIHVSAAVAR
jgi:hypothetical protein